MDFASLPPEFNSTRMYAGPGSESMLAAAAAWEALAGDLQTTASLYDSTITGLTAGPWLGPASASMSAAAAPYVAWLRITATQAEEAATLATAAAGAYETAFAATVPPPVVAANRALLLALVATNLFGQNTPAIATTEAQYAEMWAQDATAMLGYAGASAEATSLTPFTVPASIADSAASVGQAAAVAQAAGTAAGDVQSAVSNIAEAFSAIPAALTGLAGPGAALPLGPIDAITIADATVGVTALMIDTPLAAGALPYDIAGYEVGLHTDDIVSAWAGMEAWPNTTPAPRPLAPIVGAALGESASVGSLSVPAGWTVAAPEMRLLATALPAANVAAAAEGSAGNIGSLLGQMAVAGMAGRALAGPVGGGGGGSAVRQRIGVPTGKPDKPIESPPDETGESPPKPPGGPITSIAAELRELASLRDAGILTDEEFTQQKQRLLAY